MRVCECVGKVCACIYSVYDCFCDFNATEQKMFYILICFLSPILFIFSGCLTFTSALLQRNYTQLIKIFVSLCLFPHDSLKWQKKNTFILFKRLSSPWMRVACTTSFFFLYLHNRKWQHKRENFIIKCRTCV